MADVPSSPFPHSAVVAFLGVVTTFRQRISPRDHRRHRRRGRAGGRAGLFQLPMSSCLGTALASGSGFISNLLPVGRSAGAPWHNFRLDGLSVRLKRNFPSLYRNGTGGHRGPGGRLGDSSKRRSAQCGVRAWDYIGETRGPVSGYPLLHYLYQ